MLLLALRLSLIILLGLPSLVAKVLMDHHVSRDGFIKTFSHFWKGTEHILIREIDSNRFCVCFVSARDQRRVLEMETLVYCRSLIWLAESPDDVSKHCMPFTHNTFWV